MKKGGVVFSRKDMRMAKNAIRKFGGEEGLAILSSPWKVLAVLSVGAENRGYVGVACQLLAEADPYGEAWVLYREVQDPNDAHRWALQRVCGGKISYNLAVAVEAICQEGLTALPVSTLSFCNGQWPSWADL